MNAIHDALRPFGVQDIAMPATPERVWRALRHDDGTPRDSSGTVAYGGASTSTTSGGAE
jgi:carbon-monoxide dehydrogenase large subunit